MDQARSRLQRPFAAIGGATTTTLSGSSKMLIIPSVTKGERGHNYPKINIVGLQYQWNIFLAKFLKMKIFCFKSNYDIIIDKIKWTYFNKTTHFYSIMSMHFKNSISKTQII